MEKIYGMHKLVGLQLFWSRTPTFSSGTPTFCQMGVLNSCFQNPGESSDYMPTSNCVPCGQTFKPGRTGKKETRYIAMYKTQYGKCSKITNTKK